MRSVRRTEGIPMTAEDRVPARRNEPADGDSDGPAEDRAKAPPGKPQVDVPRIFGVSGMVVAAWLRTYRRRGSSAGEVAPDRRL